MLKTTTSTIEGKRIIRYLGVVVGDSIVGANVFNDLLASITDVVGGRSSAYETAMTHAREFAQSEMESKARKLGANAIIGIDYDYEVIGARGSMLMVCVSGTAVQIARSSITKPSNTATKNAARTHSRPSRMNK